MSESPPAYSAHSDTEKCVDSSDDSELPDVRRQIRLTVSQRSISSGSPRTRAVASPARDGEKELRRLESARVVARALPEVCLQTPSMDDTGLSQPGESGDDDDDEAYPRQEAAQANDMDTDTMPLLPHPHAVRKPRRASKTSGDKRCGLCSAIGPQYLCAECDFALCNECNLLSKAMAVVQARKASLLKDEEELLNKARHAHATRRPPEGLTVVRRAPRGTGGKRPAAEAAVRPEHADADDKAASPHQLEGNLPPAPGMPNSRSTMMGRPSVKEEPPEDNRAGGGGTTAAAAAPAAAAPDAAAPAAAANGKKDDENNNDDDDDDDNDCVVLVLSSSDASGGGSSSGDEDDVIVVLAPGEEPPPKRQRIE